MAGFADAPIEHHMSYLMAFWILPEKIRPRSLKIVHLIGLQACNVWLREGTARRLRPSLVTGHVLSAASATSTAENPASSAMPAGRLPVIPHS